MLAALALLSGACGDEEETGRRQPPPNSPACAPPYLLPSGKCLETGVPADACAEGFEPDEQQGCVPVLPADECPPGQIAIPGDKECHELAPCPEARYGDAPVDATTEFVDAAYGGNDSDGSSDKPWKTIAEAIGAAAPTAVIAVAAGTYKEGFPSQGKAVRIWGRCPRMVEIVGQAVGYATVELSNGNGAELHTLSVSGASYGVNVTGATGVVLDRVRIHDTVNEGIFASNQLGPAAVSVRGCLVERAVSIGIAADHATVSVEDSAVRETLDAGTAPEDKGFAVYGLGGSHVTVTRSLVSKAYAGVGVNGSEGSVDGVVIRDTQVAVSDIAVPNQPRKLSLGGSVIERYGQYGVFTDADVTVTTTVFRDVVPSPEVVAPTAVALNKGATGSIEDCLVERAAAGLVVRAASATAKGTAFRDGTLPGAIVVDGSTADLQSSTFERSTVAGILLQASSATLHEITVRETAAKDGFYGDGVVIRLGSIDISAARIDDNARCGASNFGGTMRIGDVGLECNLVDLDGEIEDGSQFTFEQTGKLTCGCDDKTKDCAVQTSNLAAPSIEGVTD